MFKELKLIKLIVIAGLLAAILFKIDFLRLSIFQLYTDKLSYSQNDSVKIFASSKAKYPIFNKTKLFSLEGDEIIDIDLNLSYSDNKKEQVLLDGDDIEMSAEIQLKKSKLSPGIYLIGKDYPLLITSEQASDLTVVYPFMNNLIYQKVEEQSVFSLNLHKTSANRSVKIDEFTLGLKSLFTSFPNDITINYINDIDIEDYSKINKTKILMIYGKSNFWTLKMKENLTQFINNGGNVIFISSYLINNICWYNDKENSVLLYDKERSEKIESWHGFNGDAPRYFVGSSYLYGGKSTKKEYILNHPKHSIFKGISNLSLSSELYSSPPIIWSNEKPVIDTSIVKFYSTQILAYNQSIMMNGEKGIKAITEFQTDSTSGIIINFGAEDWCINLDSNRNKLILNSISYLK